jgi:TetR/AcrR family transcriptional regulator, mexCD-oprJ operon repressor
MAVPTRAEKDGPGGDLGPTARGILASAARTLADRGSAVSMTEIASRSGVGRATLYRHFPTREILLQELQRVVVESVGEGLRAAQLETLPASVALDRAVRVVLAVGHEYAVVIREQVPVPRDVAERLVRDPIRGMLSRGQAEGLLRSELSVEWLEDMFIGLAQAGVQQIVRRDADLEATAQTVVGAYLQGAGAPRA